jgi:hypothetical protein
MCGEISPKKVTRIRAFKPHPGGIFRGERREASEASLCATLCKNMVPKNHIFGIFLLECWNDWFLEPWKESPWDRTTNYDEPEGFCRGIEERSSNNPTNEILFFHSIRTTFASGNRSPWSTPSSTPSRHGLATEHGRIVSRK